MSNRKGAPDYEALAPKYTGMFRTIDKMQWDIGKSLYEDGIVSDGQRQRLGDKIGREPKTLKTYYEVYVNFHERWPEGRPENISHGVLEQLNRLSDEKLVDEFLKRYENSTPTRTMAEQYVNQCLVKGTRTHRSRETTSVTVGGVVFKISLDEEGMGDITVVGASKVGQPAPSMRDGAWRIEFLP